MGKISSMQTASTLNTTDMIPVVQGSGNSFANKKTTIANLSNFIFNNEGINPEEMAGLADDVSDLKSAMDDVEADIENVLQTKAPVIVNSATGHIATFADGADGMNVKSLKVNMSPIQDLHGYDHPWPAGAGKNLLEVTATGTQTIAGVTYTVNKDGSITCSGTVSGIDAFFIHPTNLELPQGTYIITGGSGVSSSGVRVVTSIVDNGSTRWVDVISENGNEFTINEGEKIDNVYLRCSTSGTVVNTTIYPMIRKSTDSADWEPYSNICPISGLDEVKVERTGFNQWDEEWEVGAFNSNTGEKIAYANCIRSKNYISVLPSHEYYCKSAGKQMILYSYDKDKNYLGATYRNNNTATLSANTHYVMLEMADNYGTTYNHDISINYSSTDHDYHAGHVQTVEISLGQTVYGGTLDVTQGVLTVNYKKIAIPKTGWQFFEVASGKGVFLNTADIPSDAVHTAIPFCNAFLGVSSAGSNIEAYEKGNNTFCFRSPTYDRIYIRADRFGTDTSAFETFLRNCEMCYKYTNPQTIQLTTQQITTLLGQNSIWSDADSVSVDYVADTKLYIEQLTEPDADMVADMNITSGKYFMVGNTLYLATSNIANGATIVVGVNCTRTSLAEALNAINA